MNLEFTLVSTVYNEISRLNSTLKDISQQSLLPSEVVIVDAGSSDGTYTLLKSWSINGRLNMNVYQEVGCNISRGRNLAIKNSSNDIIISTDFGCGFHKEWLKSIIDEFKNPMIEVVGGSYTVQENKINSFAQKSDFVLQNGYELSLDENYSVSSRSIAFRKSVWETIGGYPEWLTLAADDTIFWKLVKHYGFNYVFVAKPYVYWNRHDTNQEFALEAYRYGLGDGESRINYRNFWSNVIETACRYLFFLLILISPILLMWNFYWPLLLILPCLIGLRSYVRAIRNWKRLKSKKYNFSALLNGFIQIELNRLNYIYGYIRGMLDPDPIKKAGRKKLWEILG
jgi:glycosyltransferase involved in cell wall biosynthesis